MGAGYDYFPPEREQNKIPIIADGDSSLELVAGAHLRPFGTSVGKQDPSTPLWQTNEGSQDFVPSTSSSGLNLNSTFCSSP